MDTVYEYVKQFHSVFGLTVGKTPEIPSSNQERILRIDLLEEEFIEYIKAEENNDIVAIADALADIIYIAYGTAVAYGIPLDKVLHEVHTSNMAKLVDGKVIRREDGKVLKPEGWKPPNIADILKNHN